MRLISNVTNIIIRVYIDVFYPTCVDEFLLSLEIFDFSSHRGN